MNLLMKSSADANFMKSRVESAIKELSTSLIGAKDSLRFCSNASYVPNPCRCPWGVYSLARWMIARFQASTVPPSMYESAVEIWEWSVGKSCGLPSKSKKSWSRNFSVLARSLLKTVGFLIFPFP